MNKQLIASLAGKLAVYHRASYRARRYSLSDANIEPQLCGELRNVEARLTCAYTDEHKAVNAIALDDLIRRGKDDIRALVEEAKQSPTPGIYMDRAKAISAEIEAALDLLRLFHG